MKKEMIKHLTKDFESCVNHTKNDIEFWFARDLQHLLGYTEWRNFLQVINKAKTACETSGHPISDHFVDVNKTIALPKGATKEIPDYMLTRFACYLIAQNGDPRKESSAFAQNYFAVQTRRTKNSLINRKHSMIRAELPDIAIEPEIVFSEAFIK